MMGVEKESDELVGTNYNRQPALDLGKPGPATLNTCSLDPRAMLALFRTFRCSRKFGDIEKTVYGRIRNAAGSLHSWSS